MGVFLVKKWTFPQRRVHYVQYQYFLFYILLIWGVHTHPTHSPCLQAWHIAALHRRAKCSSVVRLVYRERVS